MTMPGDYSEELVELVARVLNGKSLFDEPAMGSRILDPLRDSYRAEARAILDALSSAGRLVPEGSEVREEWGCEPRWPVHRSDPLHWPNESAARAHQRDAGGNCRVIRRIVGPWTPSEPAQEER